MNNELLDILACPVCRTHISQDNAGAYFICLGCNSRFPIIDGIPVLLRDQAEPIGDPEMDVSAANRTRTICMDKRSRRMP